MIDKLFERMDEWRHLPSYQLERRADLFFSLYLSAALEKKFEKKFCEDLIPEFPVHVGTIYPDTPINRSFKIDYLALSSDGKLAAFVELKTDGKSRRLGQDRYLALSQQAGLEKLLAGLIQIFQATNSKRKYFHLLEHVERLGLIAIPEELRRIMSGQSLRGAKAAADAIAIESTVTECSVVYLQPSGEGKQVISFEEFRSTVLEHDDPGSRRFAQSLSEWSQVLAGRRNIKRV